MPGSTLGRPGGNLPVALTSFIGRRRELAEVKRLQSFSRLVTLTGVGGVGKTRLALRAAADLQRAFPDGVWLAELAPLEDAALLTQTVAATLGIQDRSARWPAARLADHLANKHLLLVLDNCEHLLNACAVLVDTLLRACPHLRILATSRQPLGTEGEYTFPVPTLSVPDPERPLAPEALTQYEAMSLFVDRAGAAAPGFAITRANCATVAQVCRCLDGIPLAIELAAVRLRALSVDQLLERLEDRYRLLTTGSRGAVARQRTLRALIDWSFDLCSPQEQQLWGRLSVFSDTFDLALSEAVCVGRGIAEEAVFDIMAGLVDKSILIAEENSGRVRYRMLETIRHYGQERLREAGEEGSLRRRHRDRYERLVQQAAAEWFGADQEQWFTCLQLEHANLRAALEFCLTVSGEAQGALRIAAAPWFFWIATGFLSEGRRWLDRGLEIATGPLPARAGALWVAAYLAILQNDLPAARPMLEECHSLAGKLGDTVASAYATQVSGMARMAEGDLEDARRLFERALARHRSNGDYTGVLDDLFYLTVVLTLLGESDRAVALCEEALALCEAHGELWFKSYTLWVLGFAAWQRHEPRRAVHRLRESLRLSRIFNERLDIALCVETLAWSAAAEGDAQRAARLLGAAEPIWQTIGAPLFGSDHLLRYHEQCEARVRAALGDRAFEAEFRYGAALGLDEAMVYALGEKAEPAPSRPGHEPASTLTRRENEVAELIAEGLSNKEIAAALVIAKRTATTHVENILVKLGFTSRAQIAAWVAEHRLPSP